jgi:6-pyruvoyl-tetrahydropterin synthase
MESLIRVRTSIHGKHTLKNHPVCGRTCGHIWEIEILASGEEDPDRWQMPVNERRLQTELKDIQEELSGKDIDKMIAPAITSPIGIAHWYYERLSSRYQVKEVVVWLDSELAAVLRDQ